MSADLSNLVTRLEKAVTRLEGLGAGSASSSSSSSSSGAASGAGAAFVEAYDSEFAGGSINQFFELSAKIGGDVQTQALKAKAALDAHRAVLVVASKSKEPSQSELAGVLKEVSAAITDATAFREGNRKSKEFNHISAISEGLPALGWLAVKPKPVPHIDEAINSSVFYTNRVLKDFKESDPKQADWAKAWVNALKELSAYVKKYHTTGLVWNANGGAASSAAPAAAAPAKAATPAAAPAPSAASAPKPAGLGNALFGELSKGEGVTSGLRKVDKSEMTHKNPALRASSVVPSTTKSETVATTPAKSGVGAITGPPKIELDGKKWNVENHVNNKEVIVDDTNPKQTVYIYKCVGSTIQIKGKVNNISVDNCKKCAIVFDTAVAAFEVVNCQSVQVQVLGKVPTVSVDKTDGMQVYLSKESLDTEIFSSKSSEMNVLAPVDKDGEFREFAIAEQLKSRWDGNRFVTNILEHKG